MDEDGARIRVRCKDCSFERVVSATDGKPAEVIIEHGQRTDHTLTVEHLDE